MQLATRARGRALAVGRLPHAPRNSHEANNPLLLLHARREGTHGIRRATLSSLAPSSRHARATSTASQQTLELERGEARGRTWVGLALAAAAMGIVASEAFADSTSTTKQGEEATEELTSEGDAKRTGEQINAQRKEAEALLSSKKRALRKRKTSVREGKCIVSKAAVRGEREYMEDTSYISACKRFAAVFDGHGGSAVSQYLRAQLFSLIGPELVELDREVAAEREGKGTPAPPTRKAARRERVARLLRDAVHTVDQDVLAKNEWKFQGSTAVGILLFDDVIYSVNVGDSRAILSRGGDVVELTRDHKPNDAQEKARIESLGGKVQWFGYVDAQGDPIEPYGAYRVNGNLAVARAVGDRDARPFVSGEAEVRQMEVEFDKDDFIVLASDGLWDVFRSDEVVTFVQDVLSGELGGREAWSSGGHSDTRVSIFQWSQQYSSDRSMIKAARKRRKVQMANYLVQEALFRGTSDNVSVVVIWLR